MNDPVSHFRHQLGQLIYDLLIDEEVSHTMIGPLVTVYRKLYVDEMSFVNQLVMVISDVRVPMRTELQQLSAERQRKVDIKVSPGVVQVRT